MLNIKVKIFHSYYIEVIKVFEFLLKNKNNFCKHQKLLKCNFM